jgi:hypothetical protein
MVFAGSLTALAVVAGCGGGGGGGTSSGSSGPVPTATTNPLEFEVVPASEGGTSPITQPSPGTPSVNNLTIPFTAVGQQVGILVYEVGFTGTFYAQAQNCIYNGANAVTPAIVVSPGSISGVKSYVFTVTAQTAGYCDVKISDGTNGAAILVDVTTTTGTISAVHRHN